MKAFEFEKPLLELENKLNNTEAGTPEFNEIKEEIKKKEEEIYAHLSPWEKVQISRHPNRPYTLDYIRLISKDFVELHGDRRSYDCKAIVGGLARIGTQKVMMIGHQKGRSTKDKQYRNFGMPGPEGYRKAKRLMKLAEKYNIPVVCFVDTPGASPAIAAEERGQAEAIGQLMSTMLSIRVPVISVIIGEGTSGGAMALLSADKIMILEYAWLAVLTPERLANILFKDHQMVEKAAEQLRLTAPELKKLKIIDHIIKEPIRGAQTNAPKMAASIKRKVLKELNDLNKLSKDELIAMRKDKFARNGIYLEG